MEDVPDQMTLVALEQHCQREILNFRSGKPYDDRYCLEIFYRATIKGNEDAWALIVRSYSRTVLGWLRNHPNRSSAMLYDSEENYVSSAFARFWQATRNHETEFTTLAGALKFLKLSLHGAVVDTLRAYARQKLPLPEPGSGFEEPAAEEEDDGRDLWEAIENLLPTLREKRVAYLIIHCGLKPRHVMQYCPGLFENVREVHTTWRNVLDRLKRNKDQLRWRLSDEEQ